MAAAIGTSFAQGYVLFNNGTTTKISTNSVIGGAATGVTSGAGLYYYALFVSPSATTVGGSAGAVTGVGNYAFSDSNWTLATGSLGADYGSSTATAGRFDSNVKDSNNSQGTGIASGANQQFVVVGWSANIGTTIAQVMAWYNNGLPSTAGWIGESVVSGTITPGTGGLSTPPGLFGTGAGLIPGFTLGLVSTPEPGTMALAGLGIASLLALRRKK